MIMNKIHVKDHVLEMKPFLLKIVRLSIDLILLTLMHVTICVITVSHTLNIHLKLVETPPNCSDGNEYQMYLSDAPQGFLVQGSRRPSRWQSKRMTLSSHCEQQMSFNYFLYLYSVRYFFGLTSVMLKQDVYGVLVFLFFVQLLFCFFVGDFRRSSWVVFL